MQRRLWSNNQPEKDRGHVQEPPPPPPPHEGTKDAPKISIGGHRLNAVDQFTYLGSVISNDATVTKDVDHRLS